MTAAALRVDANPDRLGQHSAQLPADGPVLLPGDVVTVAHPDGRTGVARVACTDMTAKRLYVAVTWPQPLPRRVPGHALAAAGGSTHPADQLAAEHARLRRTAPAAPAPTLMETADV